MSPERRDDPMVVPRDGEYTIKFAVPVVHHLTGWRSWRRRILQRLHNTAKG